MTVHQRNLQLLMVEIYKTKENLNPEFMKDIFITNDVPYSLRSGNSLLQPSAKTTNFGIETTPFIGYKLWQMIQKLLTNNNELMNNQQMNKLKRTLLNVMAGEAVKFVHLLWKGGHFGILMTRDLLQSPLVLIIATQKMWSTCCNVIAATKICGQH